MYNIYNICNMHNMYNIYIYICILVRSKQKGKEKRGMSVTKLLFATNWRPIGKPIGHRKATEVSCQSAAGSPYPFQPRPFERG